MNAAIIYGPSGSGKTTYANQLTTNGVTFFLERDWVRFNILGLGDWEQYKFNSRTENIVDTYWKFYIIDSYDKGLYIIISDTLCKLADRQKIYQLLSHLNYDIQFIRIGTPLEECIRRDSLRGNFSVGEAVIRGQWETLNKHKEHI